MNDTPEPAVPGGPDDADAPTSPMPAIRRPEEPNDGVVPATGPAARAASTPWLVVLGVLVLLLVAGGVYVLAADRSPRGGAGSSTSPRPTGDATTGWSPSGGDEQATTAAGGSVGLPPSKPGKKQQPGKGACQASTNPKKAGGTLVQDVTLSCAVPTSLTIATAGKAVITLDGEQRTGTVQICAAQVEFTVTGGPYKWSADGPCEP
ncbi:hypothetical protein [Cumulibacter manganitolerans]|uniref:hypothetical protein n=1 Tax=Cumulibacter manganitolerans TaxID=1884992 RepID=UPI001296A416|nr:hypothetical protein [Cumulibacter manganitolerans]